MEPAAGSAEAVPILVTRGLTKSFRRLTALKNHSAQVNSGEILGVIGPNGSGKSTFFNLVTGFLKPNVGTVSFEGREIQHMTAPQIVRLGVARTFQGTRLFPQLSVRENLRAAAQLRHRLSFVDAGLVACSAALLGAHSHDVFFHGCHPPNALPGASVGGH